MWNDVITLEKQVSSHYKHNPKDIKKVDTFCYIKINFLWKKHHKFCQKTNCNLVKNICNL